MESLVQKTTYTSYIATVIDNASLKALFNKSENENEFSLDINGKCVLQTSNIASLQIFFDAVATALQTLLPRDTKSSLKSGEPTELHVPCGVKNDPFVPKATQYNPPVRNINNNDEWAKESRPHTSKYTGLIEGLRHLKGVE